MRREPIIALFVLWGGGTASAAASDSAPGTDQAVARVAALPSETSRQSEQAEQLTVHDEALWLGEGDNRFLAVRRTSVVPETSGTFVLVRNRAAGPDAPDRLGYLRESLPRLGWNTIVFDLPDPLEAVVPTRDRERMPPVAPGVRSGRTPTAEPTKAAESAAVAPNPADAQAPKAGCFTEGSDPSVKHLCASVDRDRILARLATAAQEASRNARPVIMLGEGEAAAWVARANGDKPVAAAVVALNIDDPSAPLDGEEVSDWFEALTVPALVLQEAPRTWSPDVQLSDSTELRLLPASHPSGEERLLRRLRGWLERRQPG